MNLVIIGSIVIASVGTLAHFLYDLTKHNKFIGLFAAVNESTWEHIKIALTPILLWSLYDGFVFGQNPNYFLAKLTSIATPIIVIPQCPHKRPSGAGYDRHKDRSSSGYGMPSSDGLLWP